MTERNHGQITPVEHSPSDFRFTILQDHVTQLRGRGPQSMTPDQIDRVRASWTLVLPVADVVAAQFYERLFTLDFGLRPLFAHVDLVSQQRKLLQTLAMVVAGVDDFSQLLPAVEALGRRHVGYGVTEADYATVREALLWTLERGLGDAFDDATRAAWAAAYDLLATAMLEAAAQPLV